MEIIRSKRRDAVFDSIRLQGMCVGPETTTFNKLGVGWGQGGGQPPQARVKYVFLHAYMHMLWSAIKMSSGIG